MTRPGNVPDFTREPHHVANVAGTKVACFPGGDDVDRATVASFGDEWDKFEAFSEDEIDRIGNEYFDIVPTDVLDDSKWVLDAGCGSGRWSRYLARRVGHVDAIDPSSAIFSAAAQHHDLTNVRFTQASVGDLPFEDGAFDLVICLGVLHHVPDTEAALRLLVNKMRPGGRLLLYLYYALENHARAYRALFYISALLRRAVSGLPRPLKLVVCDIIAFSVYLPLVTIARLVTAFASGLGDRLPLAYYRNKSLRVMRNDALDRFGTPLEKRFSRDGIQKLLEAVGLGDIVFSEQAPYWHCLASRPSDG